MIAQRCDQPVEIYGSSCPRKLPSTFFNAPINEKIYSTAAPNVPEIVPCQLVFEALKKLWSRPIVRNFQFGRNRRINSDAVKTEVGLLVVRQLLFLRDGIASKRLLT